MKYNYTFYSKNDSMIAVLSNRSDYNNNVAIVSSEFTAPATTHSLWPEVWSERLLLLFSHFEKGNEYISAGELLFECCGADDTLFHDCNFDGQLIVECLLVLKKYFSMPADEQLSLNLFRSTYEYHLHLVSDTMSSGGFPKSTCGNTIAVIMGKTL